MLYYLSRLKDKFILRILRRFQDEKVLKVQKALLYPPDLAYAEVLLLDILQYTSVSAQNLSDISKTEIKSLRYQHLLLLHKLYNTRLEVKKAAIVFHELLRRDAKPLGVVRQHGFKRFLLAHILRAGLTSIPQRNPAIYKLCLALLFYITNKQKSTIQVQLLRFCSAVVIGGAADHGDIEKISKDTDIVCGINRLKSHINRSDGSEISCDISYLRGEALLNMERENQFGLLRKSTTFISVKLPLMVRNFPEDRSTLTTNIDLATPYGTLNAAPTICLDLIRYNAKKIKLVCVDFNLGDWAENYKPVHSTVINKSLIFGQHPAPLQFLVIKSLSNYYDVSLAPNPYVSLDISYRSFVNIFAKQCKILQ